jgi:hypothetical protein
MNLQAWLPSRLLLLAPLPPASWRITHTFSTNQSMYIHIVLQWFVILSFYCHIGVVAIQASAAGPTPLASWRITTSLCHI